MKYFCPEHGAYYGYWGTDRDPGCSLCERKPVPKEEWEAMMAEIGEARDRDARLEWPKEPADGLCIRWGSKADRCIRHFDHTGPCADALGNDTLSLAAEILGRNRK